MPIFDEMINDLRHEIKDEPSGHSRFQIENFIIGQQATDYGKYKQCVLEIRSRIKSYETIHKAYHEIKNQDDKLRSTEDLENMASYEILMEDIKRELYIIIEIYEELKSKINLDNREELEADLWDKKFHKELMTHVFIGSPIPIGLAQNIMSLPDDSFSKKQLHGVIRQGLMLQSIATSGNKELALDTSKSTEENKEEIDESRSGNTDNQ